MSNINRNCLLPFHFILFFSGFVWSANIELENPHTAEHYILYDKLIKILQIAAS